MYNNVLVPRNIEERKEKLRQYNIQLLSQEVIDGDLIIDESFEGITNELVKVKEVKGDVILHLNKFPSWIKNIKVNKDFYCSSTKISSLEGMPYLVENDLMCSYNNIHNLKGITKVKGNLILENNDLRTLMHLKEIYSGKKIFISGNKNLHIEQKYIDHICTYTYFNFLIDSISNKFKITQIENINNNLSLDQIILNINNE